jgi:hypothetical protein
LRFWSTLEMSLSAYISHVCLTSPAPKSPLRLDDEPALLEAAAAAAAAAASSSAAGAASAAASVSGAAGALPSQPPPSALPAVLRDMGALLTHADGLVRRRATAALAALLEGEIRDGRGYPHAALAAFFCGRLSDYPSVGPCLRALAALLQREAEDGGAGDGGEDAGDGRRLASSARAVSAALLAEVNVQAMEQPLRAAA